MRNNWGGLFSKRRFEWMEEKKFEYLKNLTVEKSVLMLESLTSPEVLNEFRKQDVSHNPLSLKFGLIVRKDGFTPRDI
jgi:hypothetical protein